MVDRKLVLPVVSLYEKRKSLFTPRKLGSTKKSKYVFRPYTVTFGSYPFQLVALLKPGFNCRSNLALSFIDKVTSGTYSFV